jgi:hypothetical protein
MGGNGETANCLRGVILRARYFCFLVAFLAVGNIALGQITEKRVRSSLGSEERPSLVEQINGMPKEQKAESIRVILMLIQKEDASGRGDNDAPNLLSLIPAIADDATLAAAVAPYLNSTDSRLKETAFEALGHGRGAATAALMEAQIEIRFRRLPDPPFHPADENEDPNHKMDNTGTGFVYCLCGLLASNDDEARKVGKKYWELVRRRYGGSAEGKAVIERLEKHMDEHHIPWREKE